MPLRSSPNTYFVKLIMVFLIAVIIILSSLVFMKNYFKVSTINIQEINRSKNIPVHGLKSLSDYNLLLTDKTQTIDFLKKSNPIVKNLQIQEVFPRSVDIIITFYDPIAQVKGDRGYIIISSNGAVLSTSESADPSLPLIFYYQALSLATYKPGNKLDFDDIRSALIFLESSLDLGLKTTKIEIKGYHMIALYAGKSEILFSQEKDIDTQKYQFETIVHQFNSQGKTFKSLDVRFDKPVIVL